MPKIRGVKPDYWTDEDIVDLSIPARLLFIGLWTFACDNGHLQDKPKQIKMRVFPGDDVSATELLRELQASGRIKRAGGWISIPNLTEHQKPDRRYFTTCDKAGCEDPPEKVSQRESRRVHGVHTPSTPGAHDGRTPSALVEGDGEGDGERKVIVKGASTSKRATALPADWTPNEDHRAFGANNHLNIDEQVEQFRDHHAAKGSTMKDWDASFRTWLRNAVKWRKDDPKPAARIPHVSTIEQPPDGLTPDEWAKWDYERRQKQAGA